MREHVGGVDFPAVLLRRGPRRGVAVAGDRVCFILVLTGDDHVAQRDGHKRTGAGGRGVLHHQPRAGAQAGGGGGYHVLPWFVAFGGFRGPRRRGGDAGGGTRAGLGVARGSGDARLGRASHFRARRHGVGRHAAGVKGGFVLRHHCRPDFAELLRGFNRGAVTGGVTRGDRSFHGDVVKKLGARLYGRRDVFRRPERVFPVLHRDPVRREPRELSENPRGFHSVGNSRRDFHFVRDVRLVHDHVGRGGGPRVFEKWPIRVLLRGIKPPAIAGGQRRR
mmetsp:Transcript_6206/g.23452  ORF Transcript_6206/g.23452 Transcript_6206/m.23452 type:complete len:278 (-) Transcript_6206:2254-3087(-)